ncbi:MAG: glycosyltransferase family 4 protein [Candidatus Levybacteria bacterium]|nr:glycosyltransferase family 4 protein [Candidatus Levybacteria bacterium]
MEKRRLKIAQIANIAETVPPEKYGGTERVVFTLTEELIRRGHDVTLFASGDSKTSANLISIYPRSLRRSKVENAYGLNLLTLLHIGYAYERASQFDIVHDHMGYFGLPTANICKTPVVITAHGPFGVNERRIFENLTHPHVVAISHSHAATAPKVTFADIIHNGLQMEHFPFKQKKGEYLLFLGRISLEKGTHFAIEAAQYLDMPLIIAAKLNSIADSPADVAYFKQYVEPRLSDRIKWIGEVTEKERNRLLSNAMCLLHPVTWSEPFGLAIIESMACGTPVIGFNLGSIPELITDGKTGFVVRDVGEMIDAVVKIDQIDRRYCRTYALSNFSSRKMTDAYEALFYRVLESQNPKSKS